jgi:hypothetical protein
VAGRDLGEGTRLAAAAGAWVVFEDEAGQNLRPPKARTWAPRGHTPVITVCGKGGCRWPGWCASSPAAGVTCTRDVDQRAAIIKNRLKRIQYRPALIDGFLAQTGLTLELQPP